QGPRTLPGRRRHPPSVRGRRGGARGAGGARMTPRSLAWIAQAADGRLHGGDRPVDAVATDTRALPQSGAPLFVALKGENFDGHDHVSKAIAGGCVAALVARDVAIDAPQVVVADTQRALADIARAAQRQRTATRVVAITGSNGKTSV